MFNAGLPRTCLLMSVNQLLCFYLIPDRLFGLCNSLLSAHVKKVALFQVCVRVPEREREGDEE